jgi:N-methylhydantoinase A/oxoprolinase/acetone carboxylase beta subunit
MKNPTYERYRPVVIEEKTSTTVLYPSQRAQIDDYGNIAIEPLGG